MVLIRQTEALEALRNAEADARLKDSLHYRQMTKRLQKMGLVVLTTEEPHDDPDDDGVGASVDPEGSAG